MATTRRTKKPSVKKGPADQYAAAGETIVEFMTPAGRGGLISVRDVSGGEKTVVEVYRQDAGVEVLASNPKSWEDRKPAITAADFLNGTFAFLTAACAHYEKTAPTVRDHCDELYRRMVDNLFGVTAGELARVLLLRDVQTGEWEQANLAANRVYKLRNELGMDTTGHAGF
jgi:hypothetical protein